MRGRIDEPLFVDAVRNNQQAIGAGQIPVEAGALRASGVEIDAPISLVWDVFSAVERWPEWTASVTRLVALDGPGLAVGKRFEIKQPKMPKLVWKVTDVTPGVSWTWVQTSPGGITVAL